MRVGDSQEGAAEARAKVAPLVVTSAELGEDLIGVGEGGVVVQPLLDLTDADLRMELDAPGEVAEAERLRADARARELDSILRNLEGVLVDG